MSEASVDYRARIEFLQHIQRLLTEGGYVATYKYALLHAIADLCVESEIEPDQPLTLTVDRIAGKFIDLYWRQANQFPVRRQSHGQVLRQNTNRQATVITRLSNLHAKYESKLPSLKRDSNAWRSAVKQVGGTIKRMPLWKLQTVGSGTIEFLYTNEPGADCIVLHPGVADSFRAFYGLIVELVRGGWARYIRRHNDVVRDSVELYGFLFGTERTNLDAYRNALLIVEGSKCFYCERSIRSEPHVDHFISWTRYPTDLGHNFVLAHAACNLRKSDFLAAEEHLGHWMDRNASIGAQLAEAFSKDRLQHDRDASIQIAGWAYGQVAAVGGEVWIRGAQFRRLGAEWRRILAVG